MMSNIDDLMLEIAQLRTENTLLKSLPQANGIALPVIASDVGSAPQHDLPIHLAINKRNPLSDRVLLFPSLFHGRPNVFARR